MLSLLSEEELAFADGASLGLISELLGSRLRNFAYFRIYKTCLYFLGYPHVGDCSRIPHLSHAVATVVTSRSTRLKREDKPAKKR